MSVQAAGAVLWRPAGDGVEIAVIHRPKHGDWTLPKGKLDPDEGALEAACREVAEETGFTARPGVEVATVRYPVHTAAGEAEKIVRYWAMEALDGAFTPTAEVDDLRWLPPDAARAALSYARDREVLARFLGG